MTTKFWGFPQKGTPTRGWAFGDHSLKNPAEHQRAKATGPSIKGMSGQWDLVQMLGSLSKASKNACPIGGAMLSSANGG